MANENQAEADSQDQMTVADPTDTAESPNSGTIEADSYEAQFAAAMSAASESEEEQGVEPDSPEQEEEAPEQEPETQEQEEEGEPEEGEPEAEGEPEEEPEPEAAKPRDRFRFKDAEDQAVAAIAKAKNISLVEAAKLFAGENATKPQDQAQDQDQATAQVETADSVQARIDELEELEAQASTALEFETANEHRKEANKLRNKLMDLKIAEVQEKSQAAANEERKFLSDYAASEAEAVKYYPDAAKADSPLHKEIIRLEAEMRDLGDPLYFSENKPFVLAKQAAKNLGIPMTNPNRVPPKKPAPNRPIQPAGGNARTTTPTSPISKIDQAVDSVKDEASYDALVAELLS